MLKEKIFYSKNRPGQYLKYFLKEENCDELQPLIIYIHGAGSRGDDLALMGRVGPIGELDRGRDIPAVIAAPQCHCDTWFELFDVLLEFIRECIDKKQIDKSRVYLCGVSMGAYTAWQVAMSRPEWFAALVPVCGGGMYWNAARLKELPIWAFHGALDQTVLPEESIHMVKAVNESGGDAKLTIYPYTAHDAWDPAFAEDELWAWLFAQRRAAIS